MRIAKIVATDTELEQLLSLNTVDRRVLFYCEKKDLVWQSPSGVIRAAGERKFVIIQVQASAWQQPPPCLGR